MTVAETDIWYPLGQPGKVASIASQRSEQRVIFSPVDNVVERVNLNLLHPFNIQECLPTDLGLFAFAAYTEQRLGDKDQLLEYWSRHSRSVIVGRVLFADRSGGIYRDLDLKGGGLLSGDLMVSVNRPGGKRNDGSRNGLMEMEDAVNDFVRAEQLHSLGIRVARPLAIITLKELILDERKISIEQAIESGFIGEDTKPVLTLRAFGVRTRIRDLLSLIGRNGAETLARNRVLIDDAKKVISAQLGLPYLMCDLEYFDWFVETHTRNTALLHKNGLFHHWLTQHNVTLDCRMVDFDDTKALTTEAERLKDYVHLKTNLSHLSGKLGLNPEKYFEFYLKNLYSKVNAIYDEVFPPEERESYFSAIQL